MNESPDDAVAAIHKLKAFDCSAEVLVIVAHDASLLGVLPFFPSKITDWDSYNYKAHGTWLFLKDFLN